MPHSYTVLFGDTFDTIARKQYGDDQYAGRIRRANPGAETPLQAGSSIVVPDLPTEYTGGDAPAAEANEVALSIDGKRFRFWSTVSITRAIDSVPTVEFSAPFESERAEFRETFKPFSFKPVTINVGGARLFTGTLIGVDPSLTTKAATVSATCYSTAGVMGDCTAPASAYPIEWDNANLRTIAVSLTSLFGISAIFEAEAGAVFERVGLSPGEKITPWLAGLAAQRDLVISATPNGDMLFTKAVTSGKPVANLTQGVSPCVGVLPSFNPQQYYSSISGVTPMLVGLEGPQHTEKNSRLTGAVRPFTFTSTDTASADIATAVRGKMGRMFGGAVSYDVPVNTWRDPSGELWAPNTLITLVAPNAMIYEKFTFLVRSVILQKSAGNESAILNVTLPGAFAGSVPEAMPWDE